MLERLRQRDGRDRWRHRSPEAGHGSRRRVMDRASDLPYVRCFVRIYPTTYDRWVSLATVEMPAKAVPEPFRWRLMRLPDLSRVTTEIVAVRVRGVDPLPGEPVVPAHRMMCVPERGEL
jgi:hypothetical protein